MPSFRDIARALLKDASIKTGIGTEVFFATYPYMYRPSQLMVLARCISETRNIPGCAVEVGCAYGATTVFLNKFMADEMIDRDYFAIDTFSGFVPEHVDYEITNRGKSDFLRNVFTVNKKSWFDQTVKLNGLDRVKSFEMDITKFDFSTIPPIAFCLLDVDLYQPIKEVLPKLYAAMSPGGIIVIDDCQADAPWDGALQAYDEFVTERQMSREIVAVKLGILRA
jgi:O-methyltransferase